MKKILQFTVVLLCALPSFMNAQNDFENHKKYWYYRSRFNNDFIKLGLDTGESLPFNTRGSRGAPPFIDPNPNPNNSITGISNELGNGDVTARHGIYLAVLATEHKLLKNNNQDVSKLNHEIFLALNTINRVDFFGEPLLDASKSPSLNGFFVRGDIPAYFVKKNYSHFNYFCDNLDISGYPQSINTRANDFGFTQTFTQGMDFTNGTISDESMDQAYYLLMGLTLTSKLLNLSETDGTNSFAFENTGVTSLAQEAINISERIINFIKSDPLWVIRNPNNSNPVSNGPYAAPYASALDNLGCFIKHNQDLPFINAGLNAANYAPWVNFNPAAFPYAPSNDFRNTFSALPTSAFAYEALGVQGGWITSDCQGFYNILAGCGNNIYESILLKNVAVESIISELQQLIAKYNKDLEDALKSIADAIDEWGGNVPQEILSWAQNAINEANSATQLLISAAQSTLNLWLQKLWVSVNVNATDSKLEYNSTTNPVAYYDCNQTGLFLSKLGSGQYFGIYLRDILHGFNTSVPNWLQWLTNTQFSHNSVKNTVRTMLDEADCRGDFNFAASNNNGGANMPTSIYWGGNNFIDRPDRLWKKTTCPQFLGEYSGTDYLLLHNLFYLDEGTSKPIENYIDRVVPFNFPHNVTTNIGSTSTFNNIGNTYGSFEFITSFKTVASNGGGLLRAGKEIALLPDPNNSLTGFSAASGSDFGAIINPFSGCGYVNEELHKSSGPNSNGDPFQDYTITTTVEPLEKKNITMSDQEAVALNDIQNYSKNQIEKLNNEFEKIMAPIYDYKKIEIYPNPNEGKFIINLKLSNTDNVTIKIINVLNQTVFEEKNLVGQYQLPVNLSHLSKGVYLAKIKYSSDKEETRKISIN